MSCFSFYPLDLSVAGSYGVAKRLVDCGQSASAPTENTDTKGKGVHPTARGQAPNLLLTNCRVLACVTSKEMALMGLMGNLASVCRRGLQTLTLFNPLSAKSDEHQFSPNNIHT